MSRDFGITPETTKAFFSGPMHRCAVGQADLLDQLPAYLEEWEWPGTLDDFISTWFSTEDAPIQPVLDFVADLRDAGIPCHIASTQERHRAEYLRSVMGLAARFDSTFFSCDVGAAKPDAAYFEYIEKSLGRRPHQLLFLDDALANIESAAARGWHTIHFQSVEDLALARQVVGGLTSHRHGRE